MKNTARRPVSGRRYLPHLIWLLIVCALAAVLLARGSRTPARAQETLRPDDSAAATPELVARVGGAMVTGITVSYTGRIFLCYPRWTSINPYTVAELVNGKARPYPSTAFNRPDRAHPERSLVSVQSVVVDPDDRLWLLDTGSIKFGPTQKGGPKIVCVDLKTNKVTKTILFPRTVALSTSYPNDIRFDLRRGGGMAYITDSAQAGPRGIIVVDLASGRSWRRLSYDPSTNPDPNFIAVVEGRPLLVRQPKTPPKHLSMGSDGIAISNDGNTLYFCPLASHRLMSVDLTAARDRKVSDKDVKATVKNLGQKPMSDGLESDAEGNVYLSDEEHHSILGGKPGGPYQTLVVSPHASDWVDTLSLATNGYLYWTANQLQRMPQYHDGKDLRQPPYFIYRVKVDGTPVLLK